MSAGLERLSKELAQRDRTAVPTILLMTCLAVAILYDCLNRNGQPDPGLQGRTAKAQPGSSWALCTLPTAVAQAWQLPERTSLDEAMLAPTE